MRGEFIIIDREYCLSIIYRIDEVYQKKLYSYFLYIYQNLVKLTYLKCRNQSTYLAYLINIERAD